jgi:hypothetical protein
MHAPVAHRVHERLRSVGWPEILVVEHCRIPHDFVHELRELHRVCGGAGTAGFEGSTARVCDVLFVVWTVEVLAVPASASN